MLFGADICYKTARTSIINLFGFSSFINSMNQFAGVCLLTFASSCTTVILTAVLFSTSCQVKHVDCYTVTIQELECVKTSFSFKSMMRGMISMSFYVFPP